MRCECSEKNDVHGDIKQRREMDKMTKQMQQWAGQFGKDYTDRNALSVEETDLLYSKKYGILRSEMNAAFVGNLDRNMKILEVGSNFGIQLLYLQQAGFQNLYGIEINDYAVELSKSKTEGINIIKGSAFDIPFKDGFFDLVFTAGVLIHIDPRGIGRVLDEIYRCTTKFIWGFEYYAEAYTQVKYRGNTDLLWKTDFARLFLNRFSDLKLVNERHYKYLSDENIDTMFLLQKGA